MAARMPMIAITISSSISVKPDVLLWVECFCMTIPYKNISEMIIPSETLVNTSSEVDV